MVENSMGQLEPDGLAAGRESEVSDFGAVEVAPGAAGATLRQERVRAVLIELRHLSEIRRRTEGAIRALPSKSTERERLRNRVLQIDATMNLALQLVESLDELQPGLGSIFTLSYIDNLTCDAIAAMFDISKRTVIRRRSEIVSAIAADEGLYRLLVGGLG